ncbi:ABC transporter permease [Paenibacillus sp. YPG26]|uniref:ABC transporter permease n=1 Tax=Paenibacillus sp. YPG26 TaxID=2878915 RepID=UPI00203B2437|nr:ABC transporter permease [Paenibacillus sp. YPG26]USB31792.1 ABC transporter permease subunit [Paenibacillus sp. YPG26]
MHKWTAAYMSELTLLFYRRKVIVIAIFSAVLPVLIAFALKGLEPLLALLAVGPSFPIEMLSLYTGLWIPLVILTLTADLFPQEVASRTLKLAFLRPVTRLHIFMAKAASLATAVGGILVILFITTFVCNLVAGTVNGSGEILSNLTAYAAAFAAMLAVSAVFVFIAQFFKSVSGFVISALVLYAAFKIAPFLLSSFSAFSPMNYTDWHMLWLSSYVRPGTLFTGALFLLASSVLFYSLGYYKFDRTQV